MKQMANKSKLQKIFFVINFIVIVAMGSILFVGCVNERGYPEDEQKLRMMIGNMDTLALLMNTSMSSAKAQNEADKAEMEILLNWISQDTIQRSKLLASKIASLRRAEEKIDSILQNKEDTITKIKRYLQDEKDSPSRRSYEIGISTKDERDAQTSDVVSIQLTNIYGGHLHLKRSTKPIKINLEGNSINRGGLTIAHIYQDIGEIGSIEITYESEYNYRNYDDYDDWKIYGIKVKYLKDNKTILGEYWDMSDSYISGRRSRTRITEIYNLKKGSLPLGEIHKLY